jgi:hypothetical protein
MEVLSGIELVTNGGMEDGDPPTGWSVKLNPETFERSGTQKHGGNYSLHLVESNGSYGYVYQSFGSRLLGKTIKVSFWYNLVSGTVGAQIYDASIPLNLVDIPFSTPGSWQYVELVYTVTGLPDMDLYILFGGAAGNYEFYIDDVSVQEMVQAPGGGRGKWLIKDIPEEKGKEKRREFVLMPTPEKYDEGLAKKDPTKMTQKEFEKWRRQNPRS